jgi:hypothetical protein
LPLSKEAYAQFCELGTLLQSIQLNSDKDTWNYIWGSAQYSSKKAYDHLLGSQQGFLLPTSAKQAKYKSYGVKEKYGPRILHV